MPDRLRRLVAALDARPAELVGLLVLLAGGAAVTAVVWLGAGVAAPAPMSPAGPDGSHVPLVDPSPSPLTVHVAGAVRRPGVVRLTAGSRVSDAIAAAGGARPDAHLDGLNLAAPVEDGQQVLVPVTGRSRGAAPTAADGAIGADGRVDLNLATAEELRTLPGIGPVLASRIIAWRERHGPFRDPGQLREVAGIGERTFQSLAERVRV